MGHFHGNQATEGIADQVIRAVRLYVPDGVQIELRHVFDAIKWFLYSVNAFRLHAVNSVPYFDTLYHLVKIHDAAAQAMGDEHRRRLRTRLQKDQRRQLWRSRLFQQIGQCSDRWGMIDGYRRQFAATRLLDFIEQFKSQRRVTTDVKEVIFYPN